MRDSLRLQMRYELLLMLMFLILLGLSQQDFCKIHWIMDFMR